MKNLPIGLKLTIGFGAVLILLLTSGGAAYYYLSDNLDSFKSYRGLARDTNLMGRVQASLLMVRMNVKDFLITDSQKDIDEYNQYMSRTEKFMNRALEEIKNPDRARMVKESSELLVKYNDQFNEVKNIQIQRNAQVDVLNRIGPLIERKLTRIMQTANDDGDITAAYYAGRALRNILLARLYVVKFLQDNKQAAVDRVHAEFKEFMGEYSTLDSEVENSGRRQLLQEIITLKKEYVSAFETVSTLIFKRNHIVKEKLDKWGPVIAKDLEDSKLSVKKDQDILGPQVQSKSEHAQSLVGILSLVATIIGLLAGVIITRVITVPLAAATELADAVSKGDFTKSIDVNQKDEVGEICKALVSIREAVSAATDEVEQIVVSVESGEMTANGDAALYSGGFADLIRGVNSLVLTYSNFLDQLPVGVMAVSPDHKVVYLNKTAQTIGGIESFKGKTCSDVFNTDDCNTDNCASDICMKSRTAASSETHASTKSGSYELRYTSIPLISREGKVMGAIEIQIDQTEIKTAQKTMFEVANRADEIADRVASASEELSAQIEEVSQGAEVQQQRVGETATAMEEMNATVLEVAKNAAMATEQSDNSKNKAEEGAVLVNDVVASINKINSVAQELQGNMEKLGRHANSIGSVMTVITDIADQTNLLALNAAIEAARAGEAGRGFAVVADEVRKLAEKTMAATTEVGKNIKTIQSAAQTNVKSVDLAVENVNEATELASSSGEALGQIVAMSADTSLLISSIATAAEQQSATSEEINGAIDEVNQIVSETTDGMVQSATAVQELAQMALELKNVLGGLTSDKS
ncbi:methyl-accepting chemotaxis protein [Maridesulfovibrio hydrothermalis]|uniref:Methyl-accepting chemotaxis sensory transducer n=1 Tax=Maridesulfovibrio hydrothermalis AM13 = DSM 14728 TaxID=1121451 RepID=L0REF4_9BACT|nr:methyl-accepting chemotaxis protein [Maridesulfovibrio hydrothermalis]CCO23911.1 Methyl-accepting chemotaxis sensory transducer [Maridesulfovibrio hydrothermalis AM13 = DSM 14728]